MKTINDLLKNRVSLEERISELTTICPNLLEGKIVYYDKNAYIRYDSISGYLYSGMDNTKYENLVNMAFPCVFYLSGIYLAKDLAEKYTINEKMQKDNSLSINEDGLLVLKGYGVVGNDSVYRSILEEYKDEEESVDEVLATIEKEISTN